MSRESTALADEVEKAKSQIQDARDAWAQERSEQAALLVEERTRLDDAEAELQAERLELDRQRGRRCRTAATADR